MTNNHVTYDRVASFLGSLPANITLVAAAKTRTVDEVQAAITAGVRNIGYNYVQEAQRMYDEIGDQVSWHLIGHLQRNKAKKAIELFDMIQTVDSVKLAAAVDQRCAEAGKTMPVLVEINSGREQNKSGVFPEQVEELVEGISGLEHVRLRGVMTMGPFGGEPEELRPYFRETCRIFEGLAKEDIPNIEMRHLSMGMSSSYRIALEEGANMIRIGTKLFGSRI